METAWADVATGSYAKGLKVTLSAVSQHTNAQVVYTLDGTTPTASSTAVASGTTIEMPAGATTTLTAGLLINGVITGIVTRQYVVSDFVPYTIDIYVNTDQVSWTRCNFHSFGGDGTRPATTWPGTNVTDKQTINDKVWYHNQYTINSKNDYVQLVFSTGTNGSPQTVDTEQIKETTFFEVLNEKTGNKYKLKASTSGIDAITIAKAKGPQRFYTLDGRLAGTNYSTLSRGVYVVNGKKVIK
jgi:alpha-amylase